MISVAELKEKYSALSDEELFELHHKIHEYTPEAAIALDQVLEVEKGGRASFLERMNRQWEEEIESAKVLTAARQLLNKDHTPKYIQHEIKSKSLSEKRVRELISQAQKDNELEKEALSMSSNEALKGILGGLIGGTIGGLILWLPLMWGEMVMGIMVFGAVWICYQFISKFTGKTKENTAVILLTILASAYAVWLGFYLYDFFGYQGVER